MKRSPVNLIVGLLLILGPIVEINYIYYKTHPSNWNNLTMYFYWFQQIKTVKLFVQFSIVFSGWALLSNMSWARKLAMFNLALITLANLILFPVLAQVSLVSLIWGLVCNSYAFYLLYKQEFTTITIPKFENPLPRFQFAEKKPKPAQLAEISEPAKEESVTAVAEQFTHKIEHIDVPTFNVVDEKEHFKVSEVMSESLVKEMREVAAEPQKEVIVEVPKVEKPKLELIHTVPDKPIVSAPVKPVAPTAIIRTPKAKVSLNLSVNFKSLQRSGKILELNDLGIWIKWNVQPTEALKKDTPIEIAFSPKLRFHCILKDEMDDGDKISDMNFFSFVSKNPKEPEMLMRLIEKYRQLNKGAS